MGKNSVIITLGRRIGHVILHKMLIKYTNRPESKHHLEVEEITYRDSAIKDSRQYNWNEKDKKELRDIAMEFIIDKSNKKYPDVNFPREEAERLVDEEIRELGL